MRLVLYLAAGVGFLGSLQSAPDRAELRKLNQEAAAAHERRDHAAFPDLSQKVVKKAPRSVGALYNLACAHALAGAGAEAVATLERLADRGGSFDLSTDPDFESLRNLPEFQGVVRKMAALEEPLGSSAVAFMLPDKTLTPRESLSTSIACSSR